MDRNYIGFCGLNCETCEARIATITNDDALRCEVARKWSELNHAEITPEMINCSGCRIEGAKTPFCDAFCAIRKCGLEKGVETCAQCSAVNSCSTLAVITKNSPEALSNMICLKENDEKSQ